jgi:hypothetical protein
LDYSFHKRGVLLSKECFSNQTSMLSSTRCAASQGWNFFWPSGAVTQQVKKNGQSKMGVILLTAKGFDGIEKKSLRHKQSCFLERGCANLIEWDAGQDGSLPAAFSVRSRGMCLVDQRSGTTAAAPFLSHGFAVLI